MIKEFRCNNNAPFQITFEQRFKTYEEYKQAVADGSIICPYCHHRSFIEPVVSVPAPAQFKGTGFYKNDYK